MEALERSDGGGADGSRDASPRPSDAKPPGPLSEDSPPSLSDAGSVLATPDAKLPEPLTEDSPLPLSHAVAVLATSAPEDAPLSHQSDAKLTKPAPLPHSAAEDSPHPRPLSAAAKDSPPSSSSGVFEEPESAGASDRDKGRAESPAADQDEVLAAAFHPPDGQPDSSAAPAPLRSAPGEEDAPPESSSQPSHTPPRSLSESPPPPLTPGRLCDGGAASPDQLQKGRGGGGRESDPAGGDSVPEPPVRSRELSSAAGAESLSSRSSAQLSASSRTDLTAATPHEDSPRNPGPCLSPAQPYDQPHLPHHRPCLRAPEGPAKPEAGGGAPSGSPEPEEDLTDGIVYLHPREDERSEASGASDEPQAAAAPPPDDPGPRRRRRHSRSRSPRSPPRKPKDLRDKLSASGKQRRSSRDRDSGRQHSRSRDNADDAANRRYRDIVPSSASRDDAASRSSRSRITSRDAGRQHSRSTDDAADPRSRSRTDAGRQHSPQRPAGRRSSGASDDAASRRPRDDDGDDPASRRSPTDHSRSHTASAAGRDERRPSPGGRGRGPSPLRGPAASASPARLSGDPPSSDRLGPQAPADKGKRRSSAHSPALSPTSATAGRRSAKPNHHSDAKAGRSGKARPDCAAAPGGWAGDSAGPGPHPSRSSAPLGPRSPGRSSRKVKRSAATAKLTTDGPPRSPPSLAPAAQRQDPRPLTYHAALPQEHSHVQLRQHPCSGLSARPEKNPRPLLKVHGLNYDPEDLFDLARPPFSSPAYKQALADDAASHAADDSTWAADGSHPLPGPVLDWALRRSLGDRRQLARRNIIAFWTRVVAVQGGVAPVGQMANFVKAFSSNETFRRLLTKLCQPSLASPALPSTALHRLAEPILDFRDAALAQRHSAQAEAIRERLAEVSAMEEIEADWNPALGGVVGDPDLPYRLNYFNALPYLVPRTVNAGWAKRKSSAHWMDFPAAFVPTASPAVDYIDPKSFLGWTRQQASAWPHQRLLSDAASNTPSAPPLTTFTFLHVETVRPMDFAYADRDAKAHIHLLAKKTPLLPPNPSSSDNPRPSSRPDPQYVRYNQLPSRWRERLGYQPWDGDSSGELVTGAWVGPGGPTASFLPATSLTSRLSQATSAASSLLPEARAYLTDPRRVFVVWEPESVGAALKASFGLSWATDELKYGEHRAQGRPTVRLAGLSRELRALLPRGEELAFESGGAADVEDRLAAFGAQAATRPSSVQYGTASSGRSKNRWKRFASPRDPSLRGLDERAFPVDLLAGLARISLNFLPSRDISPPTLHTCTLAHTFRRYSLRVHPALRPPLRLSSRHPLAAQLTAVAEEVAKAAHHATASSFYEDSGGHGTFAAALAHATTAVRNHPDLRFCADEGTHLAQLCAVAATKLFLRGGERVSLSGALADAARPPAPHAPTALVAAWINLASTAAQSDPAFHIPEDIQKSIFKDLELTDLLCGLGLLQGDEPEAVRRHARFDKAAEKRRRLLAATAADVGPQSPAQRPRLPQPPDSPVDAYDPLHPELSATSAQQDAPDRRLPFSIRRFLADNSHHTSAAPQTVLANEPSHYPVQTPAQQPPQQGELLHLAAQLAQLQAALMPALLALAQPQSLAAEGTGPALGTPAARSSCPAAAPKAVSSRPMDSDRPTDSADADPALSATDDAATPAARTGPRDGGHSETYDSRRSPHPHD